MHEGQMRMSAPCLIDHGGAEVDANACRRSKRVQEIAGAATQIKHALSFRNEEACVAPFFFVIEPMPRHPRHALVGILLCLFEDSLFTLAIGAGAVVERS